MTIGGWILFAIATLTIIGIAAWIIVGWGVGTGAKTIIIIMAAVLIVGTLFGMIWYFNNTAAGIRAFKTQKSSLNNGIERTVRVYDATGQLIQQYEGKFDVDYDDNRIIFDDEHSKRHIIYYPTGTVIIDEK